MWLITLRAKFDQYLDEPVPVHHSQYCRIGLPADYHHQLQKTWHMSLPFTTTGPGTDSAGPSDIKLLLSSFLWIDLNSNLKSPAVACKLWRGIDRTPN